MKPDDQRQFTTDKRREREELCERENDSILPKHQSAIQVRGFCDHPTLAQSPAACLEPHLKHDN